MIQLAVLSGKKAGTRMVVRHFPLRIGRAADNGLLLEDDGIWDRHLTLEFQPPVGFNLLVEQNALATINTEPFRTQVLRNGDIITIGPVNIQFWLAAARQGSLNLREGFVWALILAVTIVQFALLYWLIR